MLDPRRRLIYAGYWKGQAEYSRMLYLLSKGLIIHFI